MRSDPARVTAPTPHGSPRGVPEWAVLALAAGAAFATYFAMYAFRKPFAAAAYEGLGFGEIELKTALVLSQILGYTASKFLGIKVCSEASRAARRRTLIGLVLAAEASLVLFAVVPVPLKVVALFLNGLPLGMVWGLVVAYLEGRRASEVLLAALSCSFIVASGVVKDVGRFLMTSWGVTEWWMPAATGALFFAPFVLSVLLLDRVPPPTAADVAARSRREPMSVAERNAFVRSFWPGLVPLLAVYFFLTAYRDFRDNYGVELFTALGYGDRAAIFTQTETIVAFGVLVALAALAVVRSNRIALGAAYAIMGAGLALAGLAMAALDAGLLSGFWWMVLVGVGSYLAYVPFGSMLFERIMACTRAPGTAVFAIYLADALGYTGSVLVQFLRDALVGDVSRFAFFRIFTYGLAGAGVLLLAASAVYFLTRTGRRAEDAADAVTQPAALAA